VCFRIIEQFIKVGNLLWIQFVRERDTLDKCPEKNNDKGSKDNDMRPIQFVTALVRK